MLKRLYGIQCTQLGCDPRVLLTSLRWLPRYWHDWIAFRRSFGGKMRFAPCLQDFGKEGGATRNEYFWQDLVVAQWVNEAMPERHLDVGSRLDGFVAHVASFRKIEVLDIRPITARIPNVKFTQADLMAPDAVDLLAGSTGYCDSISCLHVLEHFGLGRYGDHIDPLGFRRGFDNLVRLLKPGGSLYLSTPMGRERVEFNANWVFSPKTILGLAAFHRLQLRRFAVVDLAVGVTEIHPSGVPETVSRLQSSSYRLVAMQLSKQVSAEDGGCT